GRRHRSDCAPARRPRRLRPRQPRLLARPPSSRHLPLTRDPPDGRGDGLPGTLRTQGRFMTPEFIYTMKDLRKVVPPKREILKGIWLSFFFGAKIGVLGLNGAGKSSLLRIMAGADHDVIG